MFPFDLDEDDEIELTTTVEAVNEQEPKPEYEIDFNTMTLTGRLITGVESIKQWVRLCLATPRYLYTQYPWSYGQEFENLIGKGYSVADLRPRLERMIKEALSQNEDITGIQNVEVTKSGSLVTVSFKIETIYGDTPYQQSLEF